MSVILWNTNALAIALAKRQISSGDKFKYLFITNCIYAASGYVAWLFVTASSGWLFWYEGFLVLVVTYFGMLRCREGYEGATDDQLLENFVILSLPLSLKLITFTWLAHISVGLGTQWIVSNLTFTSESSVFPVLEFLLNAIRKFYAFLIAAIGTGVFYLRMSKHLETISAYIGAPDTPLNTDALPDGVAPIS